MYPADLFVPVKLPAAVVRRFKKRPRAGPSTARRFDSTSGLTPSTAPVMPFHAKRRSKGSSNA